ncbi:17297_t:CDS:1, partial [Funneliformis geosporum]
QNIEDLLLIQFIKSSQIFEDSDNKSNDSEAEEAEEDKFIFLD